MSKDVGILVLAAGGSSRMGRPKQVLPWNGGTLLGHVLRQATGTGAPVLLVLGAHAEMVLEKVAIGEAHATINPDWEKGMGSSLSYGLAKILEQLPEMEAVLIVLGDQPLVDAAFLAQFLRAHKKDKDVVIATAYENGAGVPALFPKRYFPKLLELDGNQGARQLIAQFGNSVHKLSGKGRTGDIDSPEDYRRLMG